MEVALDTFHYNCFSASEGQKDCFQLTVFLQTFIFFPAVKAHSLK